MRKSVVIVVGLCLLGGLAGCTRSADPSPTNPPVAPTHKIEGSVLPASVAGYTVLGAAPVAGQLEATYTRNSVPLDLAVVTFDPTGEYGKTELGDQQWYGTSRCGALGRADAGKTQQWACVTVLTDGVMTTLSGGNQMVSDMVQLAEAIHAVLA